MLGHGLSRDVDRLGRGRSGGSVLIVVSTDSAAAAVCSCVSTLPPQLQAAKKPTPDTHLLVSKVGPTLRRPERATTTGTLRVVGGRCVGGPPRRRGATGRGGPALDL